MMGDGARIFFILLAAVVAYLLKPGLAGNVSDFVLTLGAGYAAWEYLRAYHKEQRATVREATTGPEDGKVKDIREEARQIYARLGMQAPWLLLAAMFFCALKLWSLIGEIPAVQSALWPA
jgi:hypothetical protein